MKRSLWPLRAKRPPCAKELLEGGAAACLVCRTADQVRRAINKPPVPAVVRLQAGDQTAELFLRTCPLLRHAGAGSPGPIDLLGMTTSSPAIPGKPWDLLAAVRLLLQVGRRLERYGRPCLGGSRLIDGLRPCSWTAMA